MRVASKGTEVGVEINGQTHVIVLHATAQEDDHHWFLQKSPMVTFQTLEQAISYIKSLSTTGTCGSPNP